VESCFKNKLHLKDYSTVASTSMMSTVGTSVHSKEQPQEMRFFRATSFMIWWSRRISFVQLLLLGGYEETTVEEVTTTKEILMEEEVYTVNLLSRFEVCYFLTNTKD
jgi:hypothetical protein